MTDQEKLAQPMGQYEVWNNKLFKYSGEFLGWIYIGWVGP